MVGEPNQATRASCLTKSPLSLRLSWITKMRAGHQGKPYILAQTMSPTQMVLPSKATNFETFLEKTFAPLRDLLRFVSSVASDEEAAAVTTAEDVPGAGGEGKAPGGGKSKVSVELHSEFVDFISSALSTLHMEVLEESGWLGLRDT